MKPLAITMGCPAGIGPEIILKYFSPVSHARRIPAVVVGDSNVLKWYAKKLNLSCSLFPWTPGVSLPTEQNTIPVYETSKLPANAIVPGLYCKDTAKAMVDAIFAAVNGVQEHFFSSVCTCPISKEALQLSGQYYPGHTEMLGALTDSDQQVMMMAGKSLKVTLATIHCAIADVPGLLSVEGLLQLFETTYKSLQIDFNLNKPKIAVAALNPHASEGGMFGDEEKQILVPAIKKAAAMGIPLLGPFPPDTVFFKATQGAYDAVICMYHDQGLIPFKLQHFADGVNVTLGLPIVRTSVDHGTAYDIAGQGVANPASLNAAVELAQSICKNRERNVL